jgi:N-acetyl-gamma-glutamyl-phosphate reductase
MRAMHKQRVGIFGANGFSGVELVRLLGAHPGVELVQISSEQKAGQRFGALFGPTGNPAVDTLRFETLQDASSRLKDLDFVFLATPAEVSRELSGRALEVGVRVVDLSGAHRLKDPGAALSHYGLEADPSPYGLTEWNREGIRSALRVANPGCYATAVSLGLLPLFRSGHLTRPEAFVSAVSGVSGAGRKASEDYSFSQVDSDLRAYRSLDHQHSPEIEQALSDFSGKQKPRIHFVPQLGGFHRGILAQAFVSVTPGLALETLFECFVEAYAKEPFIELLPHAREVRLRDVVGTPFCRLGLALDSKRGTAVVSVALDNLLKGAAGQAVQNFNVMAGLRESQGLDHLRRFFS